MPKNEPMSHDLITTDDYRALIADLKTIMVPKFRTGK